MSVININKNNFQEEVMNANQPVLVDFWAAWCGPCQMLGPVIEEIAAERNDIKVAKVNVDEQPELASQFQVMSIPTLVVLWICQCNIPGAVIFRNCQLSIPRNFNPVFSAGQIIHISVPCLSVLI